MDESEVVFREENQASIFDSRASASYGERERKKKKGFFLSLVFFTWLGTISHA